jgi:hypothetical protein
MLMNFQAKTWSDPCQYPTLLQLLSAILMQKNIYLCDILKIYLVENAYRSKLLHACTAGPKNTSAAAAQKCDAKTGSKSLRKYIFKEFR